MSSDNPEMAAFARAIAREALLKVDWNTVAETLGPECDDLDVHQVLSMVHQARLDVGVQ